MLHPGQLLHNRYEIEEKIGKGGQGSVYKAFDRTFKNVVAIKEAQIHSFTFLQEAFKREGQKLARYRHLGLPNALDYFEYGQNQYLVMDYIAGLDFAQRLKQRLRPRKSFFSVPEVLEWADSLLDVVIYLHSLQPPLIHRDIKPANLKLDAQGRVILLDLGISTGGLTQVTTFVPPNAYTRGYAPPEQEHGGLTDERTDIYAIGATLYHLLTLKRPPSATKRRDGHSLRRADELNPQVPRQLADLLAEAMALDPARRPKSAVEMRNRLAKLRAVAASSVPSPLISDSLRLHQRPHSQPLPPPPPYPSHTYPDRTNLQPSWWVNIWRQLIAVAVTVLLAVLFVGMLLNVIGGRSPAPDQNAGMASPSTSVPASATPVMMAEPAISNTPFPTISLGDNSTATPTMVIVEPTQAPDSANKPTNDTPVLIGTPIPRPMTAISTSNVQQITQLARFGKGQIEEIAYSPDGKLLAATSTLGVYLYNANTLEQIRFIDTGHVIFSVAFSPDGQVIATGGLFDPTIRFWRVSDGTLIRELEGHTNTVNSVLFSPNGQILASGSNDGTIRLWNASDGTLRQTLEEHGGGITNLAFDATGQTLASASYDTTARVWQTDNGQLLYTLEGHSDWVRGVAIHSNGDIVATSSQDGIVNVWQKESLLYTLSDFSGRVESVAFSPDGELLATPSYSDKEISLWRAKEGTLIETLQQAGVSDLIFSPDGNTLATTFWGHSVELWRKAADELYGFSSLNERSDHTNGMTSVALSPDGRFVASGSYDQRVRVWDLQESSLLGKFGSHSDMITGVAFSGFIREGEQVPYFTSGSGDNTVVVWNNGEVINTLEGHEQSVTSVAFQESGVTVASGSSDNTVRLWRSDGLLHTFNEHTDEVTTVTFNQNGQHVISGSKDKTVRVWKVEEGTLVNTFGDLDAPVTSVAEANNDEFIAAGLQDGTIVVWKDGSRLGTLEGHEGAVNAVTFTADGSLLASASDDDLTIILWNMEDGEPLHSLAGHHAGLTGLIFGKDNTQLVSSSNDGTVRLWGIRP